MEVKLHWRDVRNLISSNGGWNDRYELGMKYYGSMDSTEKWGGGAALWDIGNCRIYVLSVDDDISAVDIQISDARERTLTFEENETWERIKGFLAQYEYNPHEDLKHREVMDGFAQLRELINNKPTNKKSKKQTGVPVRGADLRKWAILWDFIEAKVIAENLDARSLRPYLDNYNYHDKPDWIPTDNETLQKIINQGRLENIPKLSTI